MSMRFSDGSEDGGFWATLGAVLLILIVVVIAAFMISTGAYIWYRIMAPELGWTVPHFKAIFWSTTLVTIPMAGIVAWAKS